MDIEIDDLERQPVRELLAGHLAQMLTMSPACSVHALDLERLRAPGIRLWTAWVGEHLLGCAALKELSPEHGEIKSMRTPASRRRRGAGRARLAPARQGHDLRRRLARLQHHASALRGGLRGARDGDAGGPREPEAHGRERRGEQAGKPDVQRAGRRHR